MRIKEKLQHIIKNSLKTIDIEKKLNEIIIESSNDISQGDYYTNIAINTSKDLHKKPEEVAEILKNIIKDDIIEKIKIVYPGTIYIFLNRKSIINGISEIIDKNINYGKSNIGESKKINIDYIDLDFTKPLSKENAFNAIYVDNISRILKYNGFSIEKEFYYDDVSKEINELAKITKERYDNICKYNKITIKEEKEEDIDTAHFIYKLYNDLKQQEDIEYFKKEEISTLLDIRKKELDKHRVNFNIYTNEQSLYDNGLIDTVLNILNRNGYTYFNEEELWVKTTEYKDIEDRTLIKSDGTYTYLLPQTAYYLDKLRRNYDGIISVYNNENKKYKPSLKPLLKMLNQDINKIEIKILPELEITKDNIKIENTNILENLNTNTIRYIYSSQKINELININLDLYLNNNKNPFYYIENTNILIHNLLKNYDKKITKVKNISTIDSELAYIILNKLYEFEDIVISSGLKQMPHLICDYLYELTELFNKYYESEKIITEDEVYTNERLNLLLAIKIVINNAFDLIGIIPREEI